LTAAPGATVARDSHTAPGQCANRSLADARATARKRKRQTIVSGEINHSKTHQTVKEIARLVLSKTKEDDLNYDTVDLDMGGKKKSDCPC
jgi:hypothetical protein